MEELVFRGVTCSVLLSGGFTKGETVVLAMMCFSVGMFTYPGLLAGESNYVAPLTKLCLQLSVRCDCVYLHRYACI